jgi:serine/threonine protein kinase
MLVKFMEGGEKCGLTRNDFSQGTVIGSGSYSLVWQVEELSTGKPVALKVCQKRKLRRCRSEKSMKTEMTVWKRLCHPNIIELYNIFESEDCICLFFVYYSYSI